MNSGTTPFRLLLTISAIFLAIAGIIGWLLPGLIVNPVEGTEASTALADGTPAWVSVVGVAVVVIAAFLVALSGRKVIAIATGLSDGDESARVRTGGGGPSSTPVPGESDSAVGAGAESRAVILRRVRSEVARTSRYGHALTLLVLSIDLPTEESSLPPAPVVDRILRTVGEIVQNNTRISDAFGRTDSNSLVVLLAETEVKGAARVAEKLRRNVEVYPFDQSFSVTVSIGVAAHRTGDESDELISRVERACESARAAGGNRVLTA